MFVEPVKPTNQQPSVPSGYFKDSDAYQTKNNEFIEKDINNDGLPDVRYGRNDIGQRYDQYFTYDDAGRILNVVHDFNGDKTVDFYDEYTYDSTTGYVTQKRTAYDLNGKPSGVTETEYYEFDFNNPAKNRKKTERTLGLDGDTLIREYNENGKVTRNIVDRNNDGVVDRIHEFEHNEYNQLIKEVLDNNGDLKPDETYTYTYNSDGTCDRYYDNDADGTSDSVSTLTYNARGAIDTVTTRDLRSFWKFISDFFAGKGIK